MSCEHEFSESENERIQALVKSLRCFTLPVTLFALLQFAASMGLSTFRGGSWSPMVFSISLLIGVAAFILARVARAAATDLQLIVDTEGSDISHLMAALDRVRKSVFLCLPGAVAVVLALFARLATTVGNF